MFRITGLDPSSFAALFEDERALAARGGRRVVADESPGYPCRVSLEDARVGEELVLVPFEHHPVATPYRGAGPIYVRRGATRFAGTTVPALFRTRTLSVRAYRAGELIGASVVPGTELEAAIERMLADDAEYLHVHFAGPGCFACRVDRA